MNYYNKTKIFIKVLGASQTVGRSCVIVELENRTVMFDCGENPGFTDERKYPSFNLLVNSDVNTEVLQKENLNNVKTKNKQSTKPSADLKISILNQNIAHQKGVANINNLIQKLKKINEIIDCVVVSHFHMDHIGALPFFTEVLNYKGVIIMSYPSKALSPVLLLDGCKLTDFRWSQNNFDKQIQLLNANSGELLNYRINCIKKDPWSIRKNDIYECMNKIVGLQINETYELGNLSITPYYAGHVLGACMFKIEVNGFSVLYTGDFNTVPDKHLGCTKVPSLKPDILISESTYATYVRPTKKSSELELCNYVHECVHNGGKVLIPVFAIGRAQELSIILDEYWNKMKINYPIYFACGLAESANKYYRIYSSWINNTCVSTEVKDLFNFSNIYPFHSSYLSEDRPMVVFATPGMISSGLSLRVFKAWAPDARNLIVIPGYCVQGTIGNKLIMGEKQIKMDEKTIINVACKIIYLSFSAHADSNGIQQTIKHVLPKSLVFVHGDKSGMHKLAKHMSNQYCINSICPSLGKKYEFSFCKCNIQYIYIHNKIFKTIQKKLQEKKQEMIDIKKKSKSLCKNVKTFKNKYSNLLDNENSENILVPFVGYLFYLTYREKPYLFIFSKKTLINYLKKLHIPFNFVNNDGGTTYDENDINKTMSKLGKRKFKEMCEKNDEEVASRSMTYNNMLNDIIAYNNTPISSNCRNYDDISMINGLELGTYNLHKKNNIFINNKEKILLPLINLRFKEHINISYKRFYNFVITFFQEIVNVKNKKSIFCLGKNVIIKNIKCNNKYFFFLFFHSLRAIHDGNNLLIIQWSHIDDEPNSVIY
uniref:Integrator complex subunit 11 n=1 Tax=Piliocolobus tephrosceles TaxID=591936 RepID=A0A8C9GQN2_9PRIM